MGTNSAYEEIKKADVYGFRKEFMTQSLNYLSKINHKKTDDKFEKELIFIHEVLMEINAYI